ncbi:elongation of very long chain fatty acids protein 7-like isoform X2 [Musca domestica]|uniref:Elongation of very long chain fatty acids protein n=1 Tax=Musca domestica TaxID=7370 RepID=A0ABM3UX38_MUSDO|nr:elongation of very long chain fatty acids protein 7-like isoform X2 [Musca domestica]
MWRLVRQFGLDFVNMNIDKRITENPILASPLFMIAIFTLYILIVRKWGPKYMEDRKPFKVDDLMKLYNVVQILLNAFIFYEALRYSYWRSDFSFTCEGFNPNDMRMPTLKGTRPAYLYHVSKYLDLLDTIFFLLRKKFNQISFLHVYHHALMLAGTYLYVSKSFGSHLTMIGVINSFIHIVMYTYYLAAAMKLNFDLAPWKKRLTIMQIVQFIILIFHQSLPLINNSCNLATPIVVLSVSQSVVMLMLFSNFYYQTYIRPAKKIKSN